MIAVVVRILANRDDEIQQALALWEKVFQHTAPSGWFHWKFAQAPAWHHEELLPVFGAFKGRKLVGIRPHMPLNLIKGGEVIRSVQPCDTAVHPEHRRQGIFMRMSEAAVQWFADDQVDLLFNFPNAQSLGGNLKLGWQQVAEMEDYLRVLRPAVFMRNLLASLWYDAPHERPLVVPDEAPFLAPTPAVIEEMGVQHRGTAGERSNPTQPDHGEAGLYEFQRTTGQLGWRLNPPHSTYRLVAGDWGHITFGFRSTRRGFIREAYVMDYMLATAPPPDIWRRIEGILRTLEYDVIRLWTLEADAVWKGSGFFNVQRLGLGNSQVLVARPLTERGRGFLQSRQVAFRMLLIDTF